MTDSTKPGPGDQPLVGASEAAELMGIELSTFSHLRRREAATENGSKFPKPVASLRCGPIWKTTEIQRFAKRYEKPRPGPKPGQAVRKQRAPKAAIVDNEITVNGEVKKPRKLSAVKTTKPVAKKMVAKKAVAKVPAPVA